ncbi:DUF1292 domain-containing protein [Anaerobacillus alkaliphilus]|uniref:DUF1292 domain-containing protein n=1 Tax=Anaerobacillus alkaliphilus TaxID=1548597 RepID=A0A4Q0VM65_9BACI|nr:DUF1292 domain-containing protein [Anaerobacillus alkaliphilus]RXI95519.1 DUF1292 domain-containing protein [Anaerobacillus alkaliphilus]
MEEIRDQITIQDEEGNMVDFNVEALFDMADDSYALLSSEDEVVLMRIEDDGDEQSLVGITNQEEKASILAAYALAVEASRDPNIISD